MSERAGKKGEEVFLMALACGATVEAAAQKAGIHRTTAHRRLAKPAFKLRLKQMVADMFRRTAHTLSAGTAEAARALLQVLRDPASTPGAKLSAARTLLEYGFKSHEVVDLDERVATVEAQLAGGPPV